MSDFLILALSIVLMCVGLLGCFINRIPGPILTFIGILIFNYGTDNHVFETYEIILCAVAVVATKIIDHFIPKLTSKISEFSKGGKWGCTIGSIIGIIILLSVDYESTLSVIATIIISILVIPFIGAYIGEFIKNHDIKKAVKPTLAAFTSFLIGTMIKLAVCIYCLYTTFHGID